MSSQNGPETFPNRNFEDGSHQLSRGGISKFTALIDVISVTGVRPFVLAVGQQGCMCRL
jgi:hypothetical protein